MNKRERERVAAMRAQFFGWRRVPFVQTVADHNEINGCPRYGYGVTAALSYLQELPL